MIMRCGSGGAYRGSYVHYRNDQHVDQYYYEWPVNTAALKIKLMSESVDRDTSVKAAMSVVLDAEQEALGQLAECRRQAEARLEEARRAVRAMVRQTQERISRLHSACANRNRELIEQLERDAEILQVCKVPDGSAQEALRKVVAEVARDLTIIGQVDAD